MYCATCGQPIRDGAQFCESCGAQLQVPGAVTPYDYKATRGTRQRNEIADPYKDQIAQLRLQIKQLKLDLKQINTGMSTTRSQYYQTSAFVPHGLLRRGYKWIEDIRLLGPQQQKQRLQQEIISLEQQLLGLQQAQMQWKNTRRG
ncbi:zinc ribbon domain-containing protein [Tengunoibacter tsumagoiensis]|uniref:Zinc-ribbon domain-containing protein n=1 Tax=Tengunoibacter tsumagoiensis TaxID=2014871 RepID=A0A401ZWS0_9CHLR|nr:zinc-ribbon domain-containing protein [Tengunoibacter tsumagoiensis]GCE11184.1 hypothetical protein KTT_10430 [Tengunoibacter tsumagoiensis]